ncbi:MULTISPECIES: M24 family metallopeptidase [Halolamina]|uniref:Xaa-Pro aminopeptidase n=1 Tax=Halolamina pelagica TaxID=699431 RepID=A0A1I5QQ21_9EURY|nr:MULTISPECIES: M24 family metallopeptidase [Halolamina]NHX35479.1 M24 family metallopeptidase [Halolamina sp. R1-12]SFP48101.1 Xaa-Pro aminopeptidase [Halolamina pelagica]
MVDLDARADRLDAYLAATGADAVWFARPNAFAWLTGGDNAASASDAVGVAAAGYAPERTPSFCAVALAGEADRIAAEELPEAFTVETVPWHEPLGDAVAAETVGSGVADFDAPGLDRVDAGPLRQPLAADDVERYRALAEETAAAVERVARELDSEDAEYEAASALRIALSSGEMSAPVVRVAGSERAEAYHSPPAGADELGDYAVITVTTERRGLHASLSRTVAFDPPERFEAQFRAAARVEATALAATREAAESDGDAGDVFDAIRAAYDEVGFPDAWEAGEQGGAAGFARREWLAAPDAAMEVRAPMGYAYNPVVGGARSEDTYLVEDGEDAFECLTATPNWPTFDVDAVGHDLTLERHAPYAP